MTPDSYEKFVKDAIAFRKSVWKAKDVVVKPMSDGRELLYSDGVYVCDLKESHKKYCHMVEQCNKNIELWKGKGVNR